MKRMIHFGFLFPFIHLHFFFSFLGVYSKYFSFLVFYSSFFSFLAAYISLLPFSRFLLLIFLFFLSLICRLHFIYLHHLPLSFPEPFSAHPTRVQFLQPPQSPADFPILPILRNFSKKTFQLNPNTPRN